MSYVAASYFCRKKHVLQSKLVSYIDSSNEEDLHVDVNFDEPTDLAIN